MTLAQVPFLPLMVRISRIDFVQLAMRHAFPAWAMVKVV
jgi:hypothetical protein